MMYLDKYNKERWLPLIVAFLLYISFINRNFYLLWSQSKIFTDLPSFYVTARLIASGISPYNYDAAIEIARQIGVHYFPFLYLPISAPLFLPLSLCSYSCVQKASLIVNQFLTLGVLYLLFFYCLPEWLGTPTLKAISFVLVFSFTPIDSTINNGQVNLVVLFLLCLMWLGLRKRYDLLVSFSLTLAILIKTTPAVFLLFLLLKKRYTAILYSILMLSVVTVCVWLVMPSSLTWWSEWLLSVAPTGLYGREIWHLFSPAHILNQSINGAMLRLGGILGLKQNVISIISYVLATLLIIIAAYWIYNKQNSSMLSLALEINLFLILMILIAPLSWHHHLVFVLPAIILGFSLAFHQTSWKSIAWLMVSLFLSGLLVWYSPVSLSLQFYGVLGLFVMYCVELATATFLEKNVL